jgi:hypothetical protein
LETSGEDRPRAVAEIVMIILGKVRWSTNQVVPKLLEPSRTDLVQVYRSQADSALGCAEKAASQDIKELYLRLAECWGALAQFETLALSMR